MSYEIVRKNETCACGDTIHGSGNCEAEAIQDLERAKYEHLNEGHN